ncbi:MAG: hypothetical protein GTN69_06825 [Armatimonadetes bacterium]|nr:hypothetical protein [Armatimonadota bacterium]NIO75585.1 hypothetical protein [Armatimonadota bacterium]NIO98199.1 hypothetical protein [Armatimonadota bacterium]
MKTTATKVKCLAAIICITMVAAALGYTPKRQIAVTLSALPEPGGYMHGQELAVTLVIRNGLDGEIGFPTFADKPNSWNGETYNCSLVDIYREGEPGNLFLAAPEMHVPPSIPGPGVRYIKPGESLEIELDMSKWQLRDGWRTGKYKAVFRVDQIIADEYVRLSVLSDPVTFEIN